MSVSCSSRPDLGRQRRGAGDRQPPEDRTAARRGPAGALGLLGAPVSVSATHHRRARADRPRRGPGRGRDRAGRGPFSSRCRATAIRPVSWHVVTDAGLRLHDTADGCRARLRAAARRARSIYLCGATVQGLRTSGTSAPASAFDVLRRWLRATRLRRRVHPQRHRHRRQDHRARPPTRAGRGGVGRHPRARVHRGLRRARLHAAVGRAARHRARHPRWSNSCERLIDAGHAYAAGGDVYFDVRPSPSTARSPGSGSTTCRRPRASATGKRDPRDFALWKGAKPGEPSWATPWGRGRPGWHLECSAMAAQYLGAEFDIHGGGLDLVFPHHENEIAQSRRGRRRFARYWLHNAWVTMGGEKMSKSLGNCCWSIGVVRRVRPVELRYYLGSAHYRSMLEFSETAWRTRSRPTPDRGLPAPGATRVGAVDAGDWTPRSSRAALDDDLGVPQALADVHHVRAGNRALDVRRPRHVRSSRPPIARCSTCSVRPARRAVGDRATRPRPRWPRRRPGAVPNCVAATRRARRGLGAGRRDPRPAQGGRHRGDRHRGRPAWAAARNGK